MSGVDPDIAIMKALDEPAFTHQYVIPLFIEKGMKDVRYTHGVEEYGRDIIAFTYDEFNYRRNVAVQVKVIDIKASNSADIIQQGIDAFTIPYFDHILGYDRRINRLYIVTSGGITPHTKKRMTARLSEYGSISLMDGFDVLNHLKYIMSSYLEYTKVEKIMDDVSLMELFLDNEFLLKADEIITLLTRDEDKSPLECINMLPRMLMADPLISQKIGGRGILDQRSILHWFSIRLIVKAWYIYGKDKKFSVIEETV